METHKIILENICKFYIDKNNNKTIIFNNFSSVFSQQESYAIVGKSGSGKSTLLKIIAGFDTAWKGKISYEPKEKPRHPRFGFIFQNNYLIEQLTCLENIALAPIANGVERKKAIDTSLMIMEQLEIQNKKSAYPNELSGGQQARVCIARALAIEPDFLIADEPTANLDFQTSTKVIDALLELKNKFNKGLIISTHDTELAQKLGVIINM